MRRDIERLENIIVFLSNMHEADLSSKDKTKLRDLYIVISRLRNTGASPELFMTLAKTCSFLYYLYINNKDLLVDCAHPSVLYQAVDVATELKNRMIENTLTKECLQVTIANVEALAYSFNGDYITYDVKKKQIEEALGMDDKRKLTVRKPKKLVPSKIVKDLDKYVIGQEDVKKSVAVCVANHYNVIQKNPDMKKSSLLVIGESGSGKTLIFETLGKILDKQVHIIDCASLSKSGYVGESVNDKLTNAFFAGGKDLEKFENSIIVWDEIDKKVVPKGRPDSIDEGATSELLKIIEGAPVTLGDGRQNQYPVETKNIMMVFLGSFHGLIDKIAKKAKGDADIGFGGTIGTEVEKSVDNRKHKITHQDLIEFGVMPEILGRIGLITHTDPITPDLWRRILTEPKGCVMEHYTKMFEELEIDDNVTEEDIDNILSETKQLNLGARGLRAIADNYFINRLYY